MYYYVNPVIELIACIISFICLTHRGAGWYRNFTWYLLLVVLAENAGYLTYFYFKHNNHWIYNCLLPVSIFFITGILYKICQPRFNSKPIIIMGLVVFMLSYLIESIRSNFLEYSAITKILFSVWVVFLCLLYYANLIKEETNIEIYTYPPFWIITGLFFFYFVSTTTNLFFDYLIQVNKKSLVPIRYSISLILNFILYGTWSYAFICYRKNPISS